MKKIWFYIPKSSKYILPVVFVLVVLTGYSDMRKPDLQKPVSDFSIKYRGKYVEALWYLTSNKWISDTIRTYHLDPDFAMAIVFPEMVRYSQIKNQLETSGLFTLYVRYGVRYANFSVGRFQMKPTFVQQLERDALKYGITIGTGMVHQGMDTDIQSRLERVKRLNSPLYQLRYLIAFIRIMDKKLECHKWTSIDEKLRFYATAYNVGYGLPENVIRKQLNRKQFYLTFLATSTRYCYSEISSEIHHLMKRYL